MQSGNTEKPVGMSIDFSGKKYVFLDEVGDATFYQRGKVNIVGTNGV